MTRRGWVLFATMCLLWGVPYLLIRVAGAEVGPFVLVFVRAAVAAVLLVPVAALRGQVPELLKRWRLVLAFAGLEIALPFTLIAYGEQHLTSSLAGLLVAAVPLFVAVLAVRFDPTERVSGLRLLGLGIGLAGVVLLLGLDVGGDAEGLLAAGAILLAALSYAAGAIMIKRAGAVPQPGLSAGGLAVAAVLLVVPAVLTRPARLPSAPVIASLAVLAVVCTAVALVVFTLLIGEVGSSRATVITYVNPAVAVALGVLVLHEEVGLATGAGFLLILLGSWLSTGGRPPRALIAGRRPRSSRRDGARPAPDPLL